MLAAATTGDCEAVAGRLLGQPANTLSSVALVIAGVWIVSLARRDERASVEGVVFGFTVVALGVGSVLLHGPDPSWARWAHDLAILASLASAAAVDLRLLGRRRTTLLGGWAVALVGCAAILAFSPDSQRWLDAVFGVVFGGLEVVCLRRGLHERRWWFLSVALFLVGSLAFWLGKDASPVCDPSSWIQPHAIWHVLQAAALAAWSVGTFARQGPAGAGSLAA